MGSFYTNIHLQSADSALIAQAWQQFWDEREESSRAFISPAYGGWMSVFDWRTDQGDADTYTELAAFLSRITGCVVLAFRVQDSDLAEYWLFSGGDEADHYSSNSEYFAAYEEPPHTTLEEGIFDGFGPDSTPGYPSEEDLTEGGNTGLLRSLTRTSAGEMELEAILRTPAAIADDILTALASALHINDTWAAVGYHYLMTEGDVIPGFDAFQHLPIGQPPTAERLFPEHDG